MIYGERYFGGGLGCSSPNSQNAIEGHFAKDFSVAQWYSAPAGYSASLMDHCDATRWKNDMTKFRALFLLAIPLLTSITFNSSAQCFARANGGSGQVVLARERPGPSMFWAHAGWDPDGWPAITYGPMFFNLPPLMQELTRIHECMHISVPTMNEFEANCRALDVMRQRGLSENDENSIAEYHMLPELQILPPQYGGSGWAFWNGTIECAGSR